MRLASAFPFLALTTLMACAIGPAQPDVVQLDRDLLRVRMSTGATCLGPAPAAGAENGWSGRLQDCANAYAYVVAMDPGTNPLRFVLEEVLGALGGDGILAPLATVTITDDAGRVFVFETPERIGALEDT